MHCVLTRKSISGSIMWISLSAGIVNPIEAKLRKGKGAVGAYGNERTQQSLQDFPVIDSEEEEEQVSLHYNTSEWVNVRQYMWSALVAMGLLKVELKYYYLYNFIKNHKL